MLLSSRTKAESTDAASHIGDASYAPSITEAALRFNVPAAWIKAIIRVESGGNPRAISPKGAMGLMQLMPATWADLRAQLSLGSDPFDPRDNVLAGTAYLRNMLDHFGAPGFLAAYHAGPGRYEAYRDRHRPLPPETQAYVAKLQPLLGSHGTEPITVAATINSRGWTHAPLFVAHVASTKAVASTSSQSPPQDRLVAAGMQNLSPPTSRAKGLFVAVSIQGQQP